MTARSVVLSLLLGASEDGLRAADLVAIAGEFGIAPSTTRVALSRLVAAGDLIATDTIYRLSSRHRRRQERQEAALHPRLLPYDGTWTMLVVTGTGRSATERAQLRRGLTERRFAELREGVWMRPDNLGETPPVVAAAAEPVVLQSKPADDHGLAARLWDVAARRAAGHALLAASESSASLREKFETSAAIVRYLRDDPWLPPELLANDWPAGALRAAYEDFRTELTGLHPGSAPEQPNDHLDPRIGVTATE